MTRFNKKASLSALANKQTALMIYIGTGLFALIGWVGNKYATMGVIDLVLGGIGITLLGGAFFCINKNLNKTIAALNETLE